MSEAPDLLEPLIGYRAWRPGLEGVLYPWGAPGEPWTPGTNTAVCIRRPNVRGAPHRAPFTTCTCGFYALGNSSDGRLHGDSNQVVGAVAAWGDIQIYRTGFRAEHAAIVALAYPPTRDGCRWIDGAADHYGVEAVPRSELESAAARFGRPLDPRLVMAGEPQPPLPPLGAIGIALNEHVWAKPARGRVHIGLTEPFIELLGACLEMTLPPIGSLIDAGAPLAIFDDGQETLIAWSRVSGRVTHTNGRISRARSWIAAIEPTDWHKDAQAFCWGRNAEVVYRAAIGDDIARGIDPFADLRLLPTGPIDDLLAEYERRRDRPRFATANDLYAACAEPVAERIAGKARVGTTDVVVEYIVTQPRASMTLAVRDGRPRFLCGANHLQPDVVLTLSAETAVNYFAGRVDVARALRSGEIRSSQSLLATLRVASLVKELLSGPPGRRRPTR